MAQQSRGSMGHSKHRKAFGKTNRNPTNNMRTARELNADSDEAAQMRWRKRPRQYDSVIECIKSEAI